MPVEMKEKIIERIPLTERNAFQTFLMQEMGAKRGDYESQREWVEKYAKLVSDIIDDASREDNKIIRPLIMDGKFKEATEHVLKALKEKL